jgi:hypothetical protein
LLDGCPHGVVASPDFVGPRGGDRASAAPTLCDDHRRKTTRPPALRGSSRTTPRHSKPSSARDAEHSPGLCDDFSLIVKAGTRHLPFTRHAHHAVTPSREGRSGTAHGFGLRQTQRASGFHVVNLFPQQFIARAQISHQRFQQLGFFVMDIGLPVLSGWPRRLQELIPPAG